jgi:hypothetical protein
MYNECVAELDTNELEVHGEIAVDETLELESIELSAVAATDLSAISDKKREELQRFLVACFQASVSVDRMSTYLGIDTHTVRSELRHGIEAWNAKQGRMHA